MYHLFVFVISVFINLIFYYILMRFRSRTVLVLIVLANILALCFYKYSTIESVVFPLAISFYTFGQISFLVDAYMGEIKNEGPLSEKILDYVCYITYFPKLLQGPISSYNEIMPEIKKMHENRFDWDKFYRFLLLFTLGLGKKVILADTFGAAVSYGYTNIENLSGIDAIIVIMSYSFQIYFDFSGYTDMAVAVSNLLGVRLPDNFDSPYKAGNILEFWKRWHISLTRFFTKYVYIPLGGNRKGTLRMCINFLIVFILSGMWHGNTINFVLWGLLHGALYVITRLIRGKEKRNVPKLLKVLDVTLTFIYVSVAWVFFRAADISQALNMLTRVFSGGLGNVGLKLAESFRLDEIWYVLKVTPIADWKYGGYVCMVLFMLFSSYIVWGRDNAIKIASNCRIRLWQTFVIGIVFVWAVISLSGVSTYIYLNF